MGDGFGDNLDGANQDTRDDLDEDFHDDPNFSIDVEELLPNWEEDEPNWRKRRLNGKCSKNREGIWL